MSNDKFNQVIDDFVKDLLVTFPELKDKLTDVNKEAFLAHCSESYPKIFFELFVDFKLNFILLRCCLSSIKSARA